MKTVIAKKWHEVSKLGEATFTGVPVMVPDDFPAKKGQAVNIDPRKVPMAGIAGDLIQRMDREIAKQWVIDFVERRRDAGSITADEIYGILLKSDGVRHTQQPAENTELCALPLIFKRNDFVACLFRTIRAQIPCQQVARRKLPDNIQDIICL